MEQYGQAAQTVPLSKDSTVDLTLQQPAERKRPTLLLEARYLLKLFPVTPSFVQALYAEAQCLTQERDNDQVPTSPSKSRAKQA